MGNPAEKWGRSYPFFEADSELTRRSCNPNRMSSEKALVKERVWGIFSVAFRLNYGYFFIFQGLSDF